jgi:CO dehydrogenase maturation factor
MVKVGKPLVNRRIGIVGKGGSGKSTVAIFLAKALVRSGYRVCILDADSTNLGFPQALGIREAPDSLIDYFGGMVFSGGSVSCPVDDPRPLPAANVTLEDLPQRYYRLKNGIVLFIAGKIGDRGPGAGCDGPISKVARDFRLHSPTGSFVTLIDFKAGFEDSARGAITSLDWAIGVIDPTNTSVELASDMKNLIEQIHAGETPATQHLETPELVKLAQQQFRDAKIRDVYFILNRVQDEEMERYLREALTAKGLSPFGVLHDDHAVALSWLKGTPIELAENKTAIDGMIMKLGSIAASTSV